MEHRSSEGGISSGVKRRIRHHKDYPPVDDRQIATDSDMTARWAGWKKSVTRRPRDQETKRPRQEGEEEEEEEAKRQLGQFHIHFQFQRPTGSKWDDKAQARAASPHLYTFGCTVPSSLPQMHRAVTCLALRNSLQWAHWIEGRPFFLIS